MYQLYVADYRETKSIARNRKKKIIIYIYILAIPFTSPPDYLGENWTWRADSVYYLSSILGNSGIKIGRDSDGWGSL